MATASDPAAPGAPEPEMVPALQAQVQELYEALDKQRFYYERLHKYGKELVHEHAFHTEGGDLYDAESADPFLDIRGY